MRIDSIELLSHQAERAEAVLLAYTQPKTHTYSRPVCAHAELEQLDLINFTPGYEAYALAFGGQADPSQWTVDPSQLGLPSALAPTPAIPTSATYGLPALPALPQLVLPPVNPASVSTFDGGLASPLGLGPASQFDFGDYDETEDLPALELDEAEVPADEGRPPPAAPVADHLDLIQSTSSSIPPTHLRPNPSPPAAALRAPSPSPAPAPTPRPTRNATKPPPVATRTPLPTTSATRPHATGFRGASTKLVALDAPIGHRTYKTDSATSRKRKTTQTQRAMDKRRKADSVTPAPSGSSEHEHVKEEEAEGEEVPDDLLSAEERKRLQNTLSARKSRQRKQERLGLLEEENVELKKELEVEQRAHEETRRKLDEAMALLRTMGLA